MPAFLYYLLLPQTEILYFENSPLSVIPAQAGIGTKIII